MSNRRFRARALAFACGGLVILRIGFPLGAAGGEVRPEKIEWQEMLRGEAELPGEGEFYAVKARRWPAGLVPVYAVEREGRVRLSRFPKRGRENFSEPIFFGAPNSVMEAKISGRWQCVATREDGSKEWLAWELACQHGEVRGRFDPDTDFRFAHITEGKSDGTNVTFRVEYIRDAYEIRLEVKSEENMEGHWSKLEGNDRGSLQAGRDPVRVNWQEPARPLFEWVEGETGKIRYSTGEVAEAGWTKNETPLCRVWMGPVEE